jgi:hypothetical protein
MAKSPAKPTPTMAPAKGESVSVRRIDNGYITAKSGYVGTGSNRDYRTTEVFTPDSPIKPVKK